MASPMPPAVQRVPNTVLRPDIFISAVVRLATWQVKPNEGRRVNMLEKKLVSLHYPDAP